MPDDRYKAYEEYERRLKMLREKSKLNPLKAAVRKPGAGQ